MRSERGFTLIELMICVALLGILVDSLAGLAGAQRARAAEIVARERALDVLEYQAASAVAGHAPDPVVAAKLLAMLPGASLEVTRGPGTTHFEVSWGAGRGRASRSLDVVGTAR